MNTLRNLFCSNLIFESSLAWEIPWMEKPGRLQFMGSLWVWHDWVTSLSLFTFMHWKEMATHPSLLAWRIPGMGEPGGLPSVGSHRVGHDWSDLAAAAAAYLRVVIEFILKMYFYITDLEGACHQDADIVGSWPTFATNYLCDLGPISLGLSGSWDVIISKSSFLSMILSINTANFQLSIVDVTYGSIPWGKLPFELFWYYWV